MDKDTRIDKEASPSGPVTYRDEDIIRFEEGILGFPKSSRYILVPHEADSPFVWLQSIDEDNLVFLLINPVCVRSDYVVELPASAASKLNLTSASEGVVFAIVVVPEDPSKMRMNLRAPIIINSKERLGRQVVLEDNSLPVKCPVLPDADPGC